MATQKQIDANRINAQKSTGPKTPEGKAASRLNRLTHGLRAEEHVLPGEDPEEFKAFVDAWVDDWKPATMARRELVEEAATAAWRRKRCRRVEAARIARRICEARARQAHAENARVDRALAHLRHDPRRPLETLMACRTGIDRLMELWSEIERASRSIDGWVDDVAHHETLLALRGGLADDPPERELDDASWSLYVRNVPAAREPGDPAEPIDDEAASAIAACIHSMATDSLAWLAALHADLPDPHREAEAQAFEPRAGDASLLRYEAHLSRQFHRSLGNLVKLMKSGDDLVVASEENAPNEPNLAAESVGGEGVAADPEIAEAASKGRPAAAETPAGPACDACAAPRTEENPAPRPARFGARGR